MTHAMVTVAAPLDPAALDGVRSLIDTRFGNPANAAIREKLSAARDGDDGIHFASLHAIKSHKKDRAFLILEFSADGTQDEALSRIVRAIGADLQVVFAKARGWSGDLAAHLRRHVVMVGHGWFDPPGICFAGTPGMSVGRIENEARLAAQIARLLSGQPGGRRAIERLNDIRATLRVDSEFAWALKPGTPLPETPKAMATWQFVGSLVARFARVFLWPLGLIVLAWATYRFAANADQGLVVAFGAFVSALIVGTFYTAIGAAIAAMIAYVKLLAAERADEVDERAPNAKTLDEIFARENHGAQNHMVSITCRKPGVLRAFTLRLVFWAISQLASRLYSPGFLSGIGTIHFARWITPPGTRDLIFFSNYGGSWESYLEDFITRASRGLTGVWSNSTGFPRTSSLIFDGATDGERFKRYARQSMQPTLFWYSAYPDVTTAHARTNAAIRQGVAAAETNEEAQTWLSLFGSTPRPDFKLESSDIQSLVFGGLGFMPCGICLLFDLPEGDPAKQWLADIAPMVAFNDGRRLGRKAAITIGLARRALDRLGLPAECVATFPAAFLDGMPKRARVLGDFGANAVDGWRWGRTTPDVALLVYGDTDGDVADLERQIVALGLKPAHRVPLKPVESGKVKKEPFGFADGISQPLIRGSYKALRDPSPLHVVAPGEFVIGYPDNRGHIPPAPTLDPRHDPQNLLPIAGAAGDFASDIKARPRDVARNGTFLVIRQLEQHVAAFYEYCEDEAQKQKAANRLGPPYEIDQEFIAAKLVGRWKDGSPLVRHPYLRADEERAGSKQVEDLSLRRGTTQAAPPRPVKEYEPENDFTFGEEDPEGLRCPYGAHIRRTNPRDSLVPGSPEQIQITNRHRLLRVGRLYEPEPGRDPGLFFMCINGDLERQFEFTQQTWVNSPSFHGLVGEQDPILGLCEPKGTGYTIPTRDGPMQLSPLSRFVTMLGGGYFFLPSKRLLRFLSADRKPTAAIAAKPREQRLA